MKLFDKLINHEEALSLVGLGYVGMPIAHAFAKKGLNVIGFDLNKEKIEIYKSGIDPTNEVGDEEIKNTKINFTSNEKDLQQAKFHIVAVPTPVNTDHRCRNSYNMELGLLKILLIRSKVNLCIFDLFIKPSSI